MYSRKRFICAVRSAAVPSGFFDESISRFQCLIKFSKVERSGFLNGLETILILKNSVELILIVALLGMPSRLIVLIVVET